MAERLVVVCIPAYNDLKKIARLLKSVDEQDYENIKVIISDDSTNNSISEYLKNWKKTYISYYKNLSPLGATQNTNKALTIATDYNPAYIKIMHQDDSFSYSNSLSQMVEEMNNNHNTNILFSALLQEHANMEQVSVVASDNEIEQLRNDWRYIFKGNFLFGPSNTLIRNTGEPIYLDEKLEYLIDVDLYLRTLRNCGNFIYVKDTLITNGRGDYQLSNKCTETPHLVSEEILYIYDKYSELHESKYVEWAIRKICLYEMRWIKSINDLEDYIFNHTESGKDILRKILNLIYSIRQKRLKHIIIYGIGSLFRQNCVGVESLLAQNRISAFVDKNSNVQYEDCKVCQPKEIAGLNYDSVIIASEKNYSEIKDRLKEDFVVPEDRIMPIETVYIMHLI